MPATARPTRARSVDRTYVAGPTRTCQMSAPGPQVLHAPKHNKSFRVSVFARPDSEKYMQIADFHRFSELNPNTASVLHESISIFRRNIQIGKVDPFLALGPFLGSDLRTTNTINKNRPLEAVDHAVISMTIQVITLTAYFYHIEPSSRDLLSQRLGSHCRKTLYGQSPIPLDDFGTLVLSKPFVKKSASFAHQ